MPTTQSPLRDSIGAYFRPFSLSDSGGAGIVSEPSPCPLPQQNVGEGERKALSYLLNMQRMRGKSLSHNRITGELSIRQKILKWIEQPLSATPRWFCYT
jgi:hypothetical protein